MQLLDLLDRRSWLVVAALGVVGGGYGAWALLPCSTHSVPVVESDDVAIEQGEPGCTRDVKAHDSAHLHRAMQRRDSLPDQMGPACALVTMGSPEHTTTTLVAAPVFYACDDTGCAAVAAPSATQTLQHCDNGLPQQFLLRSEFLANQWHQLWCDDLGSIAGAGAIEGNATRRIFACVPSVAESGADLTKSNVPPSRLIRRSNRNVASTVKLEALSR